MKRQMKLERVDQHTYNGHKRYTLSVRDSPRGRWLLLREVYANTIQDAKMIVQDRSILEWEEN